MDRDKRFSSGDVNMKWEDIVKETTDVRRLKHVRNWLKKLLYTVQNLDSGEWDEDEDIYRPSESERNNIESKIKLALDNISKIETEYITIEKMLHTIPEELADMARGLDG